ncbi:MAG: anti-sigma factor [Candidatus Acidiferrales bacterium]
MSKGASFSLSLLVAAALFMATAVWARKYTLTASKTVPAAKGEIETHRDKNGNTQVDLKVENLAKPSNLSPPGTTYIVWFQQQGSEPQSQGELKVGDNLKGEFKTTTRLQNFEVLVTAESDPQVKTPSGEVVLRATVQE